MIIRNIKPSSILIPILIISVGLLVTTRNNNHLLKIMSQANLYQKCKLLHSPFKTYSTNLPDYVLNFNQPLKPPIRCVSYSTMRGEIPISIHQNPKEHITRKIIQTHSWEKEHGDSIETILYENPDYGLIDIGANIGMFSLLAANMKRPVLAVEAMDVNIEKFHQSVVINRFEQYITLVTRPLSDKHETLRFIVSENNLGQSRLIQNKDIPKMKGSIHYENKTALMLDDLVELMPRKKALMVIDVEGNEGKVLRGATDLFDAIDISHVFMEWVILRPNEKKYLRDFFTERGYKPYDSPWFTTNLSTSTFAKWGSNVFWKK